MSRHKLMSLSEVINFTGLSRSTIYLYVSQGVFPRPLKLGVRRIAWTESLVDKWVDERIKAAKTA